MALARGRETIHCAAALAETITDEQRPLWDAPDACWGMYLCAQQDHLIAALEVHFPGIGPAIRAVAYHADDDMDGTWTAACCRPSSVSLTDTA